MRFKLLNNLNSILLMQITASTLEKCQTFFVNERITKYFLQLNYSQTILCITIKKIK